MKKFSLWLMFFGLVLTQGLDAKEEDWVDEKISAQEGMWFYYPFLDWDSYQKDNSVKDDYSHGMACSTGCLEHLYKDKFAPDLSEKTFIEKLDPQQVYFGAAVGIVCFLIGNYYFNLRKKNEHEHEGKKDTDPLLHFNQRLDYLETALQKESTKNLDVQLVACLTQGFSRNKLERFVTVLKRLATQYNITFMHQKHNGAKIDRMYPIDMTHVTLAIDEVVDGPREYYHVSNSENMLNTAIHEAGHAIAIVKSKNRILDHVSIIGRVKSGGRNYSTYQYETGELTMDDYKENIIISLCGGVAEQVFGFDKSWYAQSQRIKINDPIDFSDFFLSVGFDDFLARYSVGVDMEHACKAARSLIEHEVNLFLFSQDAQETDKQIHKKMHKIFEECYEKAVDLIEKHQSEIEQIAQLLMRKDIVPGAEIYHLLGETRPLYVYEMRNN